MYALVLVPKGTAMIAQLRPKTEIMPMDLRSSWLYPISLSREFGSSIVWPSKERCGATTCGDDRLCLRALLSNEGILGWRQASGMGSLAAMHQWADGSRYMGCAKVADHPAADATWQVRRPAVIRSGSPAARVDKGESYQLYR